MDWLQAFMIAGSTIGACWWMVRDSKEERRQMSEKFDSSFAESRSQHRDFYNEMKDFHGRLCTLEERYLQMMQRWIERKDG